MIGRTNASNKISSNIEIVNISLLSNQISHQDLIGTIITFSYDDYSEEILWKGTLIIRNIPENIEYTITFGEVNGYKTPPSVTYTSVKGFSRSVEATYYSEFLTLNVTGTDTPLVAIKKVKKVGVSEKYKVVDYIETNGTQYIDTGFKPNQNTRVVVDFKADNTAQHVWGSRIEWRNNSFLCCWESNFDLCVQINASNFNGGSFDAKARHTVEMSCTEFKVDGTTTATYSVDAFQCTNNLLIASVQNSEHSENFVGKYYSFKVYDGNNLVRDYIPVKNSQGVYGLYDMINDTFSSSTGSLAGGDYIYDETIATQTSVSGLHKIAYDTEYMIEASAVDGFTTPEVQYYTANQPSRNVSVDYLLAEERVTVNVSAEGGASVDGQAVNVETGVPSEGVYIEDTSYKLWTADEWDDSATANSIVVSDGSMARRIALTIILNNQIGDVNFPDEMEAISDSNLAIQDFNGKSNTNILKENQVSTTSGNFILDYIPFIFPDGVTKGYIPALGELYFLYQKKTEISEALSACGGDGWDATSSNMSSAHTYDFHSSTRCHNTVNGSKTELWLLDWDTGELGHADNYGNVTPRNARAMSEYNVPHPITNGKASFSVPYDETYTVSLSDMDGYTTPASQTYTASQPTREISMEYTKAVEHVIVNVSSDDYTDMDGYKVYVRLNVANGVYIQDVDGKLYTESEWDTTKVANGIAVVADECSFVIALEDVGDKPQWSSSSSMVSLTHTDSDEEAVLDYNGLGNTVEMLNTGVSDENTAVQYCSDYRFLNGQLGYLGAAGEWATVARFISEINELLSVVGSASIASIEYWTSTAFYTSARAWTINPVSGALYYRRFSTNNAARAFTKLCSSYTITNGKVKFDVPTGVDYVISVEDIDGYTTPEPQSFVAGVGTRTVDMVYEAVKLGVFIQGVSGKLYETDDWTSQETPNGVAVLTEECSFVISLNRENSSIRIHSSANGALDNYMTAISNETEAKADYDGATNTANIMKLQSGTSYAAGWCNAFSFPSGKKGFLPSLGQMWAAYNNKTAVDAALTKAGGTALRTNSYYWTSTFWGVYSSGNRGCWRLGWSGIVVRNSLDTNYMVRAFCSL